MTQAYHPTAKRLSSTYTVYNGGNKLTVINHADLKDKMGRYRTQSLFNEYRTITEKLKPVFNLREDHDGEIVSLRKMYLQIADPTEYEFAMAMFGSYDHWKKLSETWFLKPAVEEWRQELETKMKADAIQQIQQIAEDKEEKASTRLTALRLILQKEWEDKPKNTKGRPTKEEVEGQLKQDAEIQKQLEEDAERIGLKLN